MPFRHFKKQGSQQSQAYFFLGDMQRQQSNLNKTEISRRKHTTEAVCLPRKPMKKKEENLEKKKPRTMRMKKQSNLNKTEISRRKHTTTVVWPPRKRMKSKKKKKKRKILRRRERATYMKKQSNLNKIEMSQRQHTVAFWLPRFQKTHEKISKENLEKSPLFGIKKTPILKGIQEPIISFSAIIHSLKT